MLLTTEAAPAPHGRTTLAPLRRPVRLYARRLPPTEELVHADHPVHADYLTPAVARPERRTDLYAVKLACSPELLRRYRSITHFGHGFTDGL